MNWEENAKQEPKQHLRHNSERADLEVIIGGRSGVWRSTGNCSYREFGFVFKRL